MALMRRGVENRKTGETKMNRESSRSHCVFSCSLEGNSKGTGGLTNTRFSRLNLIDLAGGAHLHLGPKIVRALPSFVASVSTVLMSNPLRCVMSMETPTAPGLRSLPGTLEHGAHMTEAMKNCLGWHVQ